MVGSLATQQSLPLKAGSHRDLYAPNRIFFHNTSSKSHGRRQPCRGFLSCLAQESLALECCAVLKERFFLTGISRGCRNTGCISRTMDFLWGKRFFQNRVNPYGIPPNEGGGKTKGFDGGREAGKISLPKSFARVSQMPAPSSEGAFCCRANKRLFLRWGGISAIMAKKHRRWLYGTGTAEAENG